MSATTCHIYTASCTDSVDRKLQRKLQAASKASRKEQRMADRGKPTRKHTRTEEAERNAQMFAQQQTTSATATHAKKRSDKLARQLENLIDKDAQVEKLLAKAEEVHKAQYREKRVADFGRKSGYKLTASRATRQSTLVAAC